MGVGLRVKVGMARVLVGKAGVSLLASGVSVGRTGVSEAMTGVAVEFPVANCVDVPQEAKTRITRLKDKA